MKSVSAAMCLLMCLSCIPGVQGRDKPNIIVILTDDHGYADLSCQGIVNDVKTPFIDSLAAGGVRMTSGYVTAPQCTPSRAGLLSGRYQTRFGVEKNKDPLEGFNEQLTIAERLKTVGYATGMIGKWHLGPSSKIVNHGFDDVYYCTGKTKWANYDLDGNDVEPKQSAADMNHIDANSAAARAFIRRHHDKPFFLYLAYRAPHTPLDPAPKYVKRFLAKMPERRRLALAMLSAVDDGVGGIIESLRKYGLEEKTLIFFLGDNGAPLKKYMVDDPVHVHGGWDGSLNKPLNGEKGTVIEGGCRVPFIVYWKGHIPGGQVYKYPVISLDVAATVIAVAGLPSAPELDGVNLMPYLEGKKSGAPHDALFWRWMGQAAVRSGRWKYIRGGGRRYLFDVEADIGESNNLIKQYPEIAAQLDEKLQKWSKGLKPPGVDQPLAPAGSDYFDFYLDGKKKHPPESALSAKSGKPKKTKSKNVKLRKGKGPTFDNRDVSGDGFVTLKEYIGPYPEKRNVPVLTRRFKENDTNGDGKLDRTEFDRLRKKGGSR